MSAITIAINLIATNGTGSAFRGLGTSVTGAAAKLQGFRGLLRSVNPEMAMLGSAMVGAAAAFELFKIPTEAGIAAASDLQQQLTRLQFATQENTKDMPLLTAAINELAINTMFGVGEASNAFERLTEMGFSTQQILYGMSDGASKLMDGTLHAADAVNGLGNQSLYLGQALKSSAEDGAQLLGAVMHTFAGDGMDAKEAANEIAAAFFNGIPDVQLLQEAIRNGGSTAAAVGVTFKDFAITLDLLSQAGLPAAQAATSLNYYISQLASPTAKAAKALADLGILVVNNTSPAFTTFAAKLRASGAAGADAVKGFDGSITSLQAMYKAGQAVGLIPLDRSFNQWAIQAKIMSSTLFDANGNFLGLKNATDQVDTALGKVGNRQAELGYIRDIFNIRGGQDARLLSSLDAFNSKYDALANRFENTDLGKLAAAQLDTLAGAIDQLKDTVSSALATAFLPLLPALTELVQHVTDLASWFMNLDQHTKTMIATFLLVGTVLAGLAVAVLGVVVGVAAFAAILGAVGIPLTAVVGGLAAMAVGIPELALVITGIIGIQQNVGDDSGIVKFFNALVGGMSDAGTQAESTAGSFDDLGVHTLGLQGYTKQLTGAYGAFHDELDSAKNVWKTTNDNLHNSNTEMDGALRRLPSLKKSLNDTDTPTSDLGTHMGTLSTNTSSADSQFKSITDSLSNLGQSFSDLGDTLGQFEGLWHVLLVVLIAVGGVLYGLGAGVRAYFAGVLTGITGMLGSLVGIVSGVLLFLLGLWQIFFGILGDIIGEHTDQIAKDQQTALKNMGDGIGQAWKGITDFIQGLWDATVGALLSSIGTFVDNVILWFQTMFDKLVGHSIIPDMINAIVSWFAGLPGKVLQFVESLVSRGTAKVGELKDKAISKFSELVSTAQTKAGELRDKVVSAISSLPDKIKSKIQSMVDTARTKLSELATVGWDAGTGLIQNIIDGIGSMLGSLWDKVNQAASVVHNLFGHSVPHEGPLSDDDVWGAHLVDNLITGMDSRMPALAATANKLASAIRNPITPQLSATAAQSGFGGTIVIPINLDGKHMAEYTLDLASRQLRRTGSTRSLR